MSWEALNWASRQRMKLPQEQLVLLVLANCADPSGVAFAKWKSGEQWFAYLLDHTRVSRQSLFRHLKTIEELGLGRRSKVQLEDGTTRPLFCLDLEASFDIDEYKRDQSAAETFEDDGQSHGETENEEKKSHHETPDEEGSLPAGKHLPVQEDTAFPEPLSTSESHHETPDLSLTMRPKESHHETCKEESLIGSYTPPNPPVPGGCVENDFSEFEKAWVEPILRDSIARKVWAALSAAERKLAIGAARGYVAWRKRQKKPPNVINAHTFLREKGAWAKFAELDPQRAPQTRQAGAPRERISLPDFTAEGHAFAVCQAIAGTYGSCTFYRDQIPTGAESFAALRRVDERGRIDTSDWVMLKSGTPQCVAWAERVKEWLKRFPDERWFWLDAEGRVVRSREEAFTPIGALTPLGMKGLLVPRTESGFPPAKGSGAGAPVPKARAGPSIEELEGAEF